MINKVNMSGEMPSFFDFIVQVHMSTFFALFFSGMECAEQFSSPILYNIVQVLLDWISLLPCGDLLCQSMLISISLLSHRSPSEATHIPP